jgi:hypothetical protein
MSTGLEKLAPPGFFKPVIHQIIIDFSYKSHNEIRDDHEVKRWHNKDTAAYTKGILINKNQMITNWGGRYEDKDSA